MARVMQTWEVLAVGSDGQEAVKIDAHSLTLEPSGALSFWVVSPDGMRSVLILAYAPGQWERVRIVIPEGGNKDLTPETVPGLSGAV
jgi:hypothetical protein